MNWLNTIKRDLPDMAAILNRISIGISNAFRTLLMLTYVESVLYQPGLPIYAIYVKDKPMGFWMVYSARCSITV